MEELEAAGLKYRYAMSIGIAVDKRRRNKSEESMTVNVTRLNEYKSKVVLLPKGWKVEV